MPRILIITRRAMTEKRIHTSKTIKASIGKTARTKCHTHNPEEQTL